MTTGNITTRILQHVVMVQEKLDVAASLAPLKSIPARTMPQSLACTMQFWTEVNCLRDMAAGVERKNDCDHMVTNLAEAAEAAYRDTCRWMKAYAEVRCRHTTQ